mgnify:CR=1 FL=1
MAERAVMDLPWWLRPGDLMLALAIIRAERAEARWHKRRREKAERDARKRLEGGTHHGRRDRVAQSD